MALERGTSGSESNFEEERCDGTEDGVHKVRNFVSYETKFRLAFGDQHSSPLTASRWECSGIRLHSEDGAAESLLKVLSRAVERSIRPLHELGIGIEPRDVGQDAEALENGEVLGGGREAGGPARQPCVSTKVK